MSTGANFGTGTSANKSAVITEVDAGRHAAGHDLDAALRFAYSGLYTHTVADAGTGEIDLVRLPAGRVRVFSDLSRLITTQFEANADLHIGFRAYTDPDTGVVAQDDNFWEDNANVGGGALDQALTLPADGISDFSSTNGVVVYALIDTADIEASDTIELAMAYTRLP